MISGYDPLSAFLYKCGHLWLENYSKHKILVNKNCYICISTTDLPCGHHISCAAPDVNKIYHCTPCQIWQNDKKGFNKDYWELGYRPPAKYKGGELDLDKYFKVDPKKFNIMK